MSGSPRVKKTIPNPALGNLKHQTTFILYPLNSQTLTLLSKVKIEVNSPTLGRNQPRIRMCRRSHNSQRDKNTIKSFPHTATPSRKLPRDSELGIQFWASPDLFHNCLHQLEWGGPAGLTFPQPQQPKSPLWSFLKLTPPSSNTHTHTRP